MALREFSETLLADARDHFLQIETVSREGFTPHLIGRRTSDPASDDHLTCKNRVR